MKTNKLNSETLLSAATFSAGALAGGMTSRVLYDYIPLKDQDKEGKENKMNQYIKRGGLFAIGVALAAFVKGDDTAGQFVKGAGVGMAATQLNALLKGVLVKEGDKGILTTALGTPNTQTEYVLLDSSYPQYTPYEEISDPYANSEFLSGTTEEFSV